MSLGDTLGNAIRDAGKGAAEAVSSAAQGAEHAAGDAFQGVVAGVKSVAGATEHAVGDVTHGLRKAAHDASDGARHGDMLGGMTRAAHDSSAGVGQALSDSWHGAADGVGHVAHGAALAVEDGGTAGGRAFDHAVDGASRAVGDVAGKRAGDAVHGLAEGLAEPVRQSANMSYGITTGIGDGAGKLLRGTGDLVVGGVRMGTDAQYRDKLIAHAGHLATGLGHFAKAAIHDPGAAARAAGHAITGAVEHIERDGAAAAKQGKLAQFVGHAVGETGFNIVTTVGLPETKVGQVASLAAKGAEAAADLGRTAGFLGEAGRATEIAGDAGGATARIAEAGATRTETLGSAAGKAEEAGKADKYAWIGDDGSNPEIPESFVNCVQHARNVDRRVATGEETYATRFNPHVGIDFGKLNNLNETFGAPFRPMASRAELERTLLDQGEGTRGVVVGLPAHDGDGHVWNVVVDHGRVRHLDEQAGGDGAANMVGFPRTALAITGKAGDGAFHETSVAATNAHADAWVAARDGKDVARTAEAHSMPGEVLGPIEARQIARSMTQASGTADAKDVDSVAVGLAELVPQSLLQQVSDAGIKVVVTRDSIVEHLPHMRGKPLPQDPFEPESVLRPTYDGVTSAYLEGTKEVVISTHPGLRGSLGERDFNAKDLLEDLGRAVNESCFGGTPKSPLSHSPAFRRAILGDEAQTPFVQRIIELSPPLYARDPFPTEGMATAFSKLFAAHCETPIRFRADAPVMDTTLRQMLMLGPALD